MTNFIELLAIPAVAIGIYIFTSKHITKFLMNGGKSEKEIIEKHKGESGRKYFVKYPEANIQTSKNLLMAFGFIFSFASSIYAFSVLGETQAYIIEPMSPTETWSIQSPILDIEREKFAKREIPKAEVVAKIKVVEKLPVVIEKKVDTKIVVSVNELLGGDEIIPNDDQVIKTEPKFFVDAEEMPRYNGCKGLSEEEAKKCTNDKIQAYVGNIEIPDFILDNPDLGGIVYVRFVVGVKGEIEELSILKGANRTLDKLVMKHIKKMPTFASAGLQRGKAVRVQYQIPVNIILEY